MTTDDILNYFKATDALLDGHFILSSGLHSPQYLQCALALQHPSDALRFGLAIADKSSGVQIDGVVSPAIGGLVIGFAAITKCQTSSASRCSGRTAEAYR